MKPNVPEVLELVREYTSRPGNEEGGSLHIVLVDRNIGDSNVEFCMEWAADRNDLSGVIVASMLLEMTRTQRLKIAHDWRQL